MPFMYVALGRIKSLVGLFLIDDYTNVVFKVTNAAAK